MSTEHGLSSPDANRETVVPLPSPRPGGETKQTTIRVRSSESMGMILERANCSLFISTYMIGNVVTVGAKNGEMIVHFHTFDRPMGMTLNPEGIVIGSRNQIWFMPSIRDVGLQMEPKGRFDTAFFVRRSHFTGNIACHEIGWVGKELWIVNTRFSCLCTVHATCHFAPRWRPPFITALVPEDRCHLNGMAVDNGQARYVTALAETNTRDGWRANKVSGGCLIDVPNNVVVARGFAMPHSPRMASGRLFVLHSGRGRLEWVDPTNGRCETVCELPGYTRGLAIHGSLAFVGLSKIRESTSMDGVPLAAKRDQLKCGVWVVDLTRGVVVGFFELLEGFDELFDVQVLPGFTSPYLAGPLADQYEERTNWTIPPH